MSGVVDPKADAPRLDDDGHLHFADRNALIRIYDGFLARGGLPVVPQTPLAALEQITVKIGDDAIALNAQVVMIQDHVTVLRVIDALPADLVRLVDDARDQENNADGDTTPNANTLDSADVVFDGTRPTLVGNTLHFQDADHAKSLEKEVLSQLSVVASGPSDGATTVVIAIGDVKADLAIGCECESLSTETTEIRFSDIGALAGAYRALIFKAQQTSPPVAKRAPPKKPPAEATPDQLHGVDNALAAFLSGEGPPVESDDVKTVDTNAPSPEALDLDGKVAPKAIEVPEDLFGDLPPVQPSVATAIEPESAPKPTPSRGMFDIPPTGSEEELTAIVDAFDASPNGMADVYDIVAPPSSKRPQTDSIEIVVEDVNEAMQHRKTETEERFLPPSPVISKPIVLAPPAVVAPEEASTPTALPDAPPDAAPVAESKPARDATAADTAPNAPGTLDDDVLKFTSTGLRQIREGFETLGMTWAALGPTTVADPKTEKHIRIEINGNLIEAALRTVTTPGPTGTCLLRVLDINALSAVLSIGDSGDNQVAAAPSVALETSATLRGTSLAFAGIDELKAARKEIEETSTLTATCLTTPASAMTLNANVAGASLGSGWPATAIERSGGAILSFEKVSSVLEAMGLFLQAFDDATGPEHALATPILTGHFIKFSHANLARIAASEIEEHRAILVAPAVPIGVEESRNVRFQVAERPLEEEFAIRLQPVQDGKAIAFFEPADAVDAAKSLHSSLAAPSQTVGISTSDVAEAVLSKSGRVRNPSSAAQLLQIPIAAAPTTADVQTPSTPLLLRLLMGGEATVHVRIRQTTGDRETDFFVVNGREIFASVPIAKLAFALAFQDGNYAFEKVSTVDRGANKQMLTVSVIGELTRGLTRRVTTEALEAGFPFGGKCPNLNDRGRRLLEAVGFSSTQTRVASLKFSGNESAATVANAMRVPMLGWELLYTLQIMGGIDWTDLAYDDTPTAKVDPVLADWEDLKNRDSFDALGLHWSSAPRHIETAFVQAKEQYGPGSEAAKRNRPIAAKIMERLTEAYETLHHSTSRREYRKKAFSLNWSQQADLMLSHAKLATYRGDLSEARDLLEGIVDFVQNAEATALLKKLEKAGLV